MSDQSDEVMFRGLDHVRPGEQSWKQYFKQTQTESIQPKVHQSAHKEHPFPLLFFRADLCDPLRQRRWLGTDRRRVGPKDANGALNHTTVPLSQHTSAAHSQHTVKACVTCVGTSTTHRPSVTAHRHSSHPQLTSTAHVTCVGTLNHPTVHLSQHTVTAHMHSTHTQHTIIAHVTCVSTLDHPTVHLPVHPAVLV